jgi:hypothetical protein
MGQKQSSPELVEEAKKLVDVRPLHLFIFMSQEVKASVDFVLLEASRSSPSSHTDAILTLLEHYLLG